MLELIDIKFERAKKEILGGVTLCFERNGIYGILGADAVANTALAELMCGCREADSGSVMLNAMSVAECKKKVRLVPREFILDSMITPFEYLDFVGNALGLEAEKKYRQIKEAFELLGLEEIQNKSFGKMPRQYHCRISIAAALLGNPEYIVLDDPFDGSGTQDLKEMYELLEMLGKIKTLILFSHKPDEVKSLCESMAVLAGGKIVLCGKISEIEEKINSTHELHITVRGMLENIVSTVNSIDGTVAVKVLSSKENDVHVLSVEHYPDTNMKDKLFAALSAINAPMLSVKEIKLTLRDVYYSLSAADNNRTESDNRSISAKNKFGRRKGK